MLVPTDNSNTRKGNKTRIQEMNLSPIEHKKFKISVQKRIKIPLTIKVMAAIWVNTPNTKKMRERTK